MNVKAGDLAILINTGNKCRENIGRIFEVLEFIGADPHIGGACADWWFVKAVGSPAIANNGSYGETGYVRDRNLRPVSGLPIDEDVHAEERVPA